LASNLKLNNLFCIVDNNHSSDRALKMKNIADKFLSFGWKTIEIDGHNEKQLTKAFKIKSKKPIAIIANTIKGKYIKFMERNQHEWHHKNIDNDTLMKIKTILNK